MSISIKPRERDAILQSLRAGVVPRAGLRHLQVGRLDEVAAVLDDLQRIEQGGASIRFIIGRYGAGKSFFLNLARMVALERKFVVAQADITLERRLHGSGGQARNLYAELMRNLATRAKPEGGALSNVVERWVSELDHQVRSSGGTDSDVLREIKNQLRPLQELVSGFDFATVVGRYVEGFQAHNDSLMGSALRWLRAEYRTKTEARQDLEVRSIIDDVQFYDYLKLFASFVRLAGYAGLLINLDEMGVFSHRLNSSQARTANYEVLLRILNDCLQGNVFGPRFLVRRHRHLPRGPPSGRFQLRSTRHAPRRQRVCQDRHSKTSPGLSSGFKAFPLKTSSSCCTTSAGLRPRRLGEILDRRRGDQAVHEPLQLDPGSQLLPHSPRRGEGLRGIVVGDRAESRHGLEHGSHPCRHRSIGRSRSRSHRSGRGTARSHHSFEIR